MKTQIVPVDAGELRSFDGTRISYEVYGRGDKVILCCNGIACVAHAYWDPLVSQFAPEARVVLWDYRGHGRSGRPANPAEIILPSFARDAHAVLEAVGADTAVLAGHSMGVQVILEVWRDFPEAVEALIAVAGPYKRPLGTLYGTQIGRLMLPVLELTVEFAHDPLAMLWRRAFASPLPYLVARASLMVGPRASSSAMATYFEGLGNLDPAMLVRMFRSMDHHSAEDILGQIDVPLLIVAGAIDMLTPVHIAREMADKVSGSELVVVKGGGHALPIEAPNEVHKAVRSFLDSRVWIAEDAVRARRKGGSGSTRVDH